MPKEEILKFIREHLKKDEIVFSNRNLDKLIIDVEGILREFTNCKVSASDEKLVITGEFVNPNKEVFISAIDYYVPANGEVEIDLDKYNHSVNLRTSILTADLNNYRVGYSNLNNNYIFKMHGMAKTKTLCENSLSYYSDAHYLENTTQTLETYDEIGIQYMYKETDYKKEVNLKRKEQISTALRWVRTSNDLFGAIKTREFIFNRDSYDFWKMRVNVNTELDTKESIGFTKGTYLINNEHGYASLLGVPTPIEEVSEDELPRIIQQGINATSDADIRNVFQESYNTKYLNEHNNRRK